MLLGLVLIVVATSFYLADLAMRRSVAAVRRLHETAVAGVFADEVIRLTEALRAFYEATGNVGNGSAPFTSGDLTAAEMARPSPPFDLIELRDSAGQVLARYEAADRVTRSGQGLSEDTSRGEPSLTASAVGREARLMRRDGTVVSHLGLAVNGRAIRTGALREIVGTVPIDALRHALRSQLDSLRAESVLLVIATDSLAIRGSIESLRASRAPVLQLSVSPEVSIAATFAQPPNLGRIALWCMAVGAMVALFLGLIMDRHRVQRMAERSAELEHLSTELLRANRAKSEFLANVSHELRTPLNAIVGFVDLLRDGVYGELAPRQVGPVSRIEASATHLRHMVDQILDLAKMAAGRLEVHAELVDLRPFVIEVAGEMEALLSEKGLTLSIAVGATLPKVRIDPAHLRQILVNLLGNAVKFTNVGGVSIRARNAARREVVSGSGADRGRRHEGPWVALQVIDSGIGIPRREWERIFDEFEQVNAGPRGDSIRRGTGLGLSISRRLARLMDGDVTVESEEGKGSVFTVWLPAEPRAGVSASRMTG